VFIPPHDAPHILTFAMPGAPAQVVQRILSDAGICVSSGSACARGRSSPVLKAMGLKKQVVEGAIRVSLWPGNTKADLDALCDELAGIYDRLLK
jgi:cysteine desulfurase